MLDSIVKLNVCMWPLNFCSNARATPTALYSVLQWTILGDDSEMTLRVKEISAGIGWEGSHFDRFYVVVFFEGI